MVVLNEGLLLVGLYLSPVSTIRICRIVFVVKSWADLDLGCGAYVLFSCLQLWLICFGLPFWIRRCGVYLMWKYLLDLSFIHHGLGERFETKQ